MLHATAKRRHRFESRSDRDFGKRTGRRRPRRLSLESLEARQMLSASPSLVSTAAFAAGNIVGSATPQDSAVLSGGNQESGPITFTLIAPDNSVLDTEIVQVNGDGTYQTANTNVATQVGTYTWQASFAGDSLNDPANDQGGPAEQVTTVLASPTLVTSASVPGGNIVGSAVPQDSAVLAGGYQESGTITFALTAPDNSVVDTETITPSGDGTYQTANTQIATQVGSYTWHASFAGDGFNNPAADQGGSAEQVTTTKASPTISTSASETASGVVGSAALSDSVTVSGGNNPTGSVTFTLTAPNGTTSPVGTVTIAGDGTYNAPTVAATQVGTYTWHASYGGDGSNKGAADNGSNESVTTVKASPTLVSTASFKTGSGNLVGSAIPEDSAVLSGGYQESGLLTFTLTAPNNSVAYTQTITPDGDGTYVTSNATVATQAGVYTWTVTFASDGLNNAAHDQGGTAEKLATFQPGTWQSLAPTNPSAGPTGTQAINLLSDGTVILQSGQDTSTNTWYKLMPNASGSYVNGTWSPLAPMNLARLFFSTGVLPSGQLIEVGGEYYGPSNTKFTNTTEMYDPVHNTWTYIASAPSPTGTLGECPIEVLPDGRVLASDKRGPATSVYNPATNTWVAAPNKLRGDWTDEETWVKLPDNSILSYDIWSSISDNIFHAQRYVPDPSGGPGAWVDASNVDPNNPPSLLSNPSDDWELGPAFLQADGRVIQFGALGNTAIYNPATNSWSAGPAEPTRIINGTSQQLVAADDPGAMLPNGNILVTFSTIDSSINSTFVYEYNPVTLTFADVTPSAGIGARDWTLNMELLPTGQVLMGSFSAGVRIYTPSGTAPAASQPTISNIANNGNGTYTLSGTQLNGISEGADFGDDEGIATNFPILKLQATDGSGKVYYARTFNWSSTGVATGSTTVSTNFSLPANMPYGTYSLSVIANGIASAPVSFSGGIVGPSADLAVTNSGPATSTEGSNVTYSLTVTNNGPTNATNVVLTDTLGANLKYVSATKSQGNFAQSGSKVTFSFGTVAVGQTVTATVTAQSTEDGNLTNYASVICSLSDANLNNNSASATTAVAEPAIVVSAPIQVSGKNQNNVTVATFTHGNGIEPASAFVASINWGDGSTSAGTITVSGITYTVKGTHTYSANGSHTVTTTVTEPNGAGGNPKPGPGRGRGATSGTASPATPTLGVSAGSDASAAPSPRDVVLANAAGSSGTRAADWLAVLANNVNGAGTQPVADTDSLDALLELLSSSDSDPLHLGKSNGLLG